MTECQGTFQYTIIASSAPLVPTDGLKKVAWSPRLPAREKLACLSWGSWRGMDEAGRGYIREFAIFTNNLSCRSNLQKRHVLRGAILCPKRTE